MAFMLKEFTEKHALIRRYLAEGLTQTAVAEKMGMHPAAISQLVNSPLFRKMRKDYTERLDDRVIEKQANEVVKPDPVEELLKVSALEAAETVVRIMKSNEATRPSVAQKSAFDILNRRGYQAKETSQPQVPIIIINENQVELLNLADNETFNDAGKELAPAKV